MASALHQICDTYVTDIAAADAVLATEAGITGHDDDLTDFSPDGHAARAQLASNAMAAIAPLEPQDESERVAKAVFTERLTRSVEINEAGLDIASLNVIESPPQRLRSVFDVMPTETEHDWEVIAARLAKVPAALDSIRMSLLAGADAGTVAALRQVARVAEQCDTWAGMHATNGAFRTLIADAEGVPDTLAAELAKHAHAAEEAFAEFAGFLRAELAPRAPSVDAVGPDAYRLWLRVFTGADVDPLEAYEWGWEEIDRIETQMREVAARIDSSASVAEVAEQLDADPRYQIDDNDSFRDWMQRLSDAALTVLRGTHFDIPDEIMSLECRIAPPGSNAGAYYTPPSEDFTRPGRMWWAVPGDRMTFHTWREASVVYHEGVPGHHLQIATMMRQRDTLNRFQRTLASTSGLAEGWALYAERLMEELGFLSDSELLGMLDEQLLRALRVVLDIGMHLQLEIPSGAGWQVGQRWTPDLGLAFLRRRSLADSVEHLRDEIDRYLGWPGQAPVYKLGQRLWLAAREDARRQASGDLDLKDFHMRALRLGGMGLDVLRTQLTGLGG